MSTLHQLREGFGRAWDNLAEGWQDLRERASHALTRFNPTHSDDGLETHGEHVEHRASRWGLLAAEVHGNDDDLKVAVEVPGMDPDNFDIQVHGQTLLIRGEKRLAREGKRGQYYVLERAYGRFERAVPLPAEVDDARAKARYHHGVLTVTLPKVKSAKSANIKVQVG